MLVIAGYALRKLDSTFAFADFLLIQTLGRLMGRRLTVWELTQG